MAAAMEFTSVARAGVGIYRFRPGEEPPSEPDFLFPAVPTAEGCVWSADGSLLALADEKSGGVQIYDANAEYAKLVLVPPLIGGPIRNFYFSPLATQLVTYERHVKDAGNNVGLWNVGTGELRSSFILKKMTDMTWPPLKWTSLETHCCRMVQDGVVIMGGSAQKEDAQSRVNAPGIMAFEVAPKGPGFVSICIAESKGAPARCQIFRLENPDQPVAARNFYKAQNVSMMWNNMGSALLCRTSQEVDDTGKSYYGGSHLYFLRPEAQEACIIATPDDGAIHDVQWSPTQDEFFLLNGDLPCKMELYDGKKGSKKVSFGSGHRNTIRWNRFGRFVVVGGYGQLLGDTDFWDKTGKSQLLGNTRMECCVVCSWAPDGRHFLGATTSPRMRVDNKIVLYDYCAVQLMTMQFEELLNACWRPRLRGFEDRPPSPGRGGPNDPKAKAAAKAVGKSAAKAEPKKQAYRPPGARGGGGLAETLRKELGSTAASSASSGTKISFSDPYGSRLPPGASPMDANQAPSSGSGASRNARRKKAKEAAAAGADAPEQETSSTPAAAKSKASAPEPAFVPPARASQAADGGAAAAGPESENPEVEKKVRALRKKLRDIEKLEAKPEKELDPLQKEKIAGKADIVRQIQDLGAEP